MYSTIIVPIDLSHVNTGKRGMNIARKLLDDDGKIILINVIEDIPTFVAAELPVGMMQETKTQVKSDLTELAKTEGINAEVEICSGRAAPSILDAAEEHKADMIVIASHRPGLSDYFLGSTACRVVRHAQCPVLVDR